MAEHTLRQAAVASVVLIVSPVAIAPAASAAEGAAPPLPHSVSDVVLLANDGTLPERSGEVAIITASTPTLPKLGSTTNDDLTEAPASLATLLGASSVTDLGWGVPAGLPGASAISPEFLGTDGAGLDVEYFASADLAPEPLLRQAQPSSVVRLPSGSTAARVTGTVTIPVDGSYEFTLTATGAARMLMDGTEVTTLDPPEATADESQAVASDVPTTSVTLELTGGTVLPVQVEMVDETSPEPVLALGWRPPVEVTSAAVEEALKAAAAADTVLVHVPAIPARTWDPAAPTVVAGALPQDLAGLLTRVAVSNPHIVVVADAVADDDLTNWVAAAILHVPTGLVDLDTLARVVRGDLQPSGTLQVALPLPHGPPLAPDAEEQADVAPTPRFAAGHGLTYWNYELLALTGTAAGEAPSAVVEVAATGTAPGVTNLYLAASTADSQQLHPVGKAVAELEAGETESVTVPLDLSALDLDSPGAWPVTLHAGTSPEALTVTAQLASEEARSATGKAPQKNLSDRADKQHKQQKQGGIVRPAVPGLALTTGSGPVLLASAVEANGILRLTGTLPTVSVSDARQGAGTGWTVSARASDLTGPGGAVPASNLGWAPIVLTAMDGVTAGPPVAPSLSGGQGLREPAVLGHASRPVGTVQFGADFVLETPATTVPGNYTGTLTVTLFPIE